MTGSASGPASGSASDPRPRPQYGEYATPEEQRAHIRQPEVSRALDTTAPEDVPVSDPADLPPVPVTAAPEGRPAPRTRTVDRIVTFALLAYGLINVVSTVPTFLDYSAYADMMFTLLGVDAELADPAAGRPWGIAAAFVMSLGWLLTAALSWWSMRRGRLSWWIPIVAGVVFVFAAGTLMVIPLMSDPAAWDALLDSIR